jgi:hypothetical protein
VKNRRVPIGGIEKQERHGPDTPGHDA